MGVTVTTLSLTNDMLTGMEWGPSRVRELMALAGDIKARPDRFRHGLAGRFVAMIFEKPSLRTRVTFEVGISSLGGAPIFLDHTVTHLGARESVQDIAKCLDRWVHGIVARTFAQQSIDELALHARVPVINALSDRFHPCQAFADFFTLEERYGGVRGLKIAYVGDGNNTCHSLLSVAARTGAHFSVATPAGYEPDPAVVADARRMARETRAKIEILRSPEEAVAGAQAVYTDAWASMGQEDEAETRKIIFAGYQVDEKLISCAAPDAVFMHCLPAHRGQEVTEAMMDSPRSIVFDQAENRLHVQKAILLTLFN
ncbi:MAG TPA: ornithine carbamoyltransferase [Candidatus Acidoferrales bacterium]|jgi:ornithine carbamoyltransferase